MDVGYIVAIVAVIAAWFFFSNAGKASPDDAHRLVANGARLVDVRTPGEFSSGHLDGAVNIPLDQLERRLGELRTPATPVVVSCASGRRSASAKRILTGAGVSDVHDLGGIGRW